MSPASINIVDAYPVDYFAARRRFVAECARSGWELQSHRIDAPSPNDEPLFLDVAVLGTGQPASALVISSGLHGVEAKFGSAVQWAFMNSLDTDWRPPQDAAIVLLHALNPFGFAWHRRFNEDNVDLNRNFLVENEAYTGAPPLSETFRSVLMPASYHQRIRWWPARMALLAMRHGVGSFWHTMPVGQYEFPDWLFFGGHARTQSAEILDRILPTMFDQATDIVHLDMHTGLGRWSECELLLGDAESDVNCQWWHEHFREFRVRQTAVAASSYAVRGGFGQWLQTRFPRCRYRFAVAEFGTYSPRRVIQALAEELHWHLRLGADAKDHWSRRNLADVFVPNDRRWRETTLRTGLAVARHAVDVLWH